ncbi:MAG: Hpt domain-containing protein [Candidatus Thermoplasmatota archaeon]|nr:Hpt domain-containing protein [Candidatus Thermoplasmatota archaeon]
MMEIFDPEKIKDRIGGDDELLGEMIDIFLSVYPADLEKIEKAIRSKDLEGIRRSAHSMKGSISNFSEKGAYIAVREIENAAERKDPNNIPQLYERLLEELGILIKDLKEYKMGDGPHQVRTENNE